MQSPWRRRQTLLALMGVLSLGLGEPREAEATRLIPLTVEQLALGSGLVVHGRVQSLEVSRDSEGRVFTRVELAVIEVWRGVTAPRPVRCEIVVGGGTLGERRVRAAGQPEYGLGDEVVAYLARNPAGEWVTLGLSQGQFRIHPGGTSGERRVHNVFWGEEETMPSGPRSPLRRPLTLGELKRRTQEARP